MPQNPVVPTNLHMTVRPEWLNQAQEEVLEPELEIIDPHHHLWDGTRGRYLFDELHTDVTSGHNIVATVYMECYSMWRIDGPEAWRSVGESQFVSGTAAMAESGLYGSCQIAAGIVGYTNLAAGAEVPRILEKHIEISNGRFRGIRQSACWDADPNMRSTTIIPPRHLMEDAEFRRGFSHLAKLGLSYDAWIYHPQISELRELALAFPDTTIVLNHLGGPLGIGRYEGHRAEVFAEWKRSMVELAMCHNVHVKVGGLGVRVGGGRFHLDDLPPSSQRLADEWRPYIEVAIELFGVNRCMFESNFPVDKAMYSYVNCWNAFKRLTKNASAAERAALFKGTAAKTYKIL